MLQNRQNQVAAVQIAARRNLDVASLVAGRAHLPSGSKHRMYGKRPTSPVKNYDYYTDEVDRKKEVHILSFYRHEASGRNKLVAVQTHENVTFLSNYDIASDGPAKVSTY